MGVTLRWSLTHCDGGGGLLLRFYCGGGGGSCGRSKRKGTKNRGMERGGDAISVDVPVHVHLRLVQARR
jgi:hypothetical protein